MALPSNIEHLVSNIYLWEELQMTVSIDKIAFFNQTNCYKLSNGSTEVIVTTDIGPRIIGYGFVGGENILAELGSEPSAQRIRCIPRVRRTPLLALPGGNA